MCFCVSVVELCLGQGADIISVWCYNKIKCMVFPCLLNYYITALVLLFMFFHLFIYIFYCIYLFKYQLRCCKVNVTLASLLFLSENRFKLLSLSNHNVRKAIISWMLIVFFIFKYNYYIYIT